MQSRYSMIIQWSDEDEAFIVTLPEFGGCQTHGATYDDAVRNAEEVLELLVESYNKQGEQLPPPALIMQPA
jgi:predicted RNase H-like HicB family nuclease